MKPDAIRVAPMPQRHVLPPTVAKRDWRHTLSEKCWCKPVVTIKASGDVVRHHDQWTGELA